MGKWRRSLENMGVEIKNFFKGRKVMITGATGFIGSHLTKRLLEEGANVHILLKKDSNQFRIQDVLEYLTICYVDIRDYTSICFSIKNSRPQIIFHLAALRDVTRDLELIEPMIEINLKGTMNLLRGVLKEDIPLECFVNTGTSEEYGDGKAPYKEDQREIPVSPYSASKVAITYFCQMVYKTMKLPIVTLRPFLTYGPHQDKDMFIPSLITSCLEGKDFPMTEGDQTREFNFIDDVIEAFLLAASNPRAIGEVINIGNGIEYTLKDVAEKIVNMMGNPIRLLFGTLPKRPGETKHFFSNNHKAKNFLGWFPKISLDEGLEKTIDWYKNYWVTKQSESSHSMFFQRISGQKS
jgi:UDP-glucose 4-epimerase